MKLTDYTQQIEALSALASSIPAEDQKHYQRGKLPKRTDIKEGIMRVAPTKGPITAHKLYRNLFERRGLTYESYAYFKNKLREILNTGYVDLDGYRLKAYAIPDSGLPTFYLKVKA